jgi:hypothetical protein
MPTMSKRIAVAVLWFLCGWFVGDLSAYVLGVHEILAPILGVAAAALSAGDPLGVIWKPSIAGAALSAPLGAKSAALDR